jgi:5-histidylcysteine sulfoxide synthase/putative 4-mercaptohistidine N1-methyltranferase
MVTANTELPADAKERALKITKTIVLNTGTAAEKRAQVLDYFQRTWELYEKLFACLSDKAFYTRADVLRHPLIFYFGHTACFFVNKLRLAKLLTDRINSDFESLFAIGVDEMSWDDLLSDDYEWPALEKVREYRNQVRAAVENVISTVSVSVPITWESSMWAVLMGIEHERIHLETSAVLISQLPLSLLKPDPFWNAFPARQRCSTELPANELLDVITTETEITLGRPRDDNVYGWDSDYGVSKSSVPAFKASKFLVSNYEFLQFMNDGGYCNSDLWTDEGKKWLGYCQKNAERPHPLFWVPTTSGDDDTDATDDSKSTTYRLRTMLSEIDMQWDWPVEVNNLEAKAYCNWLAAKTGKHIRLPTEDEYQLLRVQEVKEDQHEWDVAPGNINLEHYCSSTPVDHFPATAGGFHDVIGNVWQHTETPVDAFQNFRVHPLYDDFSVPTFDLQHNVIKGGSWVSTGHEATTDARYAFRRHFHQYAGIRYVETDRVVQIRTDVYERDDTVNMYNEFHYGPDYFNYTNFSKAVADRVIEFSDGYSRKRALDLGCAVGRSTFELGREFEYVLGLDFSARFIRSAITLQEKGAISFPVTTEGHLVEQRSVSLADLKLHDTKDRCEFFQADACNLDTRFNGYDVILCANLIDRLYDPRAFLNMIHERLNIGGLLFITSPYTWLEEFTPKECWVGGYIDEETGKPVTTLQGLQRELGSHFKRVREPVDVTMIIRETARKFQHTNVQMSVWERTN